MLKNKYGELRSGWALTLSVLMVFLMQIVVGMAVGMVAVFVGSALGKDMNELMQMAQGLGESPVMMFGLYTVYISLLLLLFWLLYKRPLKQMGFYTKNWGRELLHGSVLGIAAISLNVLVLFVSGSARVSEISWGALLESGIWIGLIQFIFVGFFEEILSRGFMMTALKTTRMKWVIILLPAVLFGLLHILNANVTFFSLVNIALVGLVFAYLFIKTGKLWAPIGFHITWNFFQGNVFGIAVSGTTQESIMKTTFSGADWFTGGAFGAEGGAVCTVVILLCLLYVHFVVKKPDDSEEVWRLDSDLPLTRGKQVVEEIEENQID